MYPAQTSLLPVAVQMAQFWQQHGWASWWMNYPYWYLGTTPFRYLTGPILPMVIVIVNRILGVQMLDVAIGLVVAAWVVQGIGWGRLFGKRVELVWFVLPWHIVSDMLMGELGYVWAMTMVPWITLEIKRGKRVNRVKGGILIGLALLFSPQIWWVLVVATIAGGVAWGKWDWKMWVGGVGLATIWYTPGLWGVMLTNPSIGGKGAIWAVVDMVSAIRSWIPLVLAVVFVKFGKRPETEEQKWVVVWGVGFGLMTLVRFVADWDFWMDWTIWFGQLEVALAVIIVLGQSYRLKMAGLIIEICLVTVIGWRLWRPYSLVAVDKLRDVAGDKLVFVSGSPVWWGEGLTQVRGGRDEVAVDKLWREAAWEIREGSDSSKSLKLLKELKVSYVLVHMGDSREFFHDFKHLDKWHEVGEVVWAQNGDEIIAVR